MAGKQFSVTAILGVNSSKMAKGLKSAGRRMTRWAKVTMAKVAGIIKAGMLLAAAAFAAAAATGVRAFMSFEQGMNEVFTLLPGITGRGMKLITDQTMELSRRMGVIPEEVVPALYQALSAGIPVNNVFSFMETAIRVSIAGVTSLETAVNGLTGVINAYGKENMSAARASDIMFTAVRLGKTTFEEMSASLGDATPLAAALGISFEELAAALAASTGITGNTAKSMTGLKNMMAELGKAGMKASNNFQAISGKTFPQFIAAGGTMQQALKMMKAHADRTGGSIMDLFGGLEAGQAALQLTEGGAGAFAAAIREMGNAAGATDTAFAQMNTGLGREIDKLKAGFKVAMIQFGKALAPLVRQLVPHVMKIIKAFEELPWAKIINGLALVWHIGLKPTFLAVANAIRSLPWMDLWNFMLPIASLVIKTIQRIGRIIVALAPMIIPMLKFLAGMFVFLYAKMFILIYFFEKIAREIGAVFKSIFQIIAAAIGFLIDPSKDKVKNLTKFIKAEFVRLGIALVALFKKVFEVIWQTVAGAVAMIGVATSELFGSMWQSISDFFTKWPAVTKALESFSDAWDKVKREVALAAAIMVDAYNSVFGGMGKNIGGSQKWADAMEYLDKALGTTTEYLVMLGEELMKLLGWLAEITMEILGGLAPSLYEAGKVAMDILGAAVYFLIEGFNFLLGALIQIIKWLQFLEPLLRFCGIVIVGFVAAVVEGVKAIWGIIKWLYKGIKEGIAVVAEIFVEAWYAIKSAVTGVIDFILGLFKKLKDFVFHILFGGTITKDFKAAFDYIERTVMRVLNAIFKIFKQFKEIAKTILEGIAQIFATVLDGIDKTFRTIFNGISKVVEALGKTVSRVFDSIGRMISTILDSFTNMAKVIESLFGKVLDLGAKALDMAASAIEKIGGVLGLGGESEGGKGGSHITYPLLRTSLKPILSVLKRMDGTLQSIDKSLKGKFLNQ